MEEIRQYRHENKYNITYAQYLSLRKLLTFFFGKRGTLLSGQQPVLDFLFQREVGKVIVVIPDPELFTIRNSFLFFQQRLICEVIKINAADAVGSILSGVRIRLHHRAEPLP